MSKDKISTKTKAHQVYKLKSGQQVPGASTISKMYYDGDKTGILMNWAVKMFRDLGADWKKVRDEKAEIGSLAHEYVELSFSGQKPTLNEVSSFVNTQAMHSYGNWLEWAKGKLIEPLITDNVDLISEKYKYGGRLDFFGKVNNNRELLDIKTGGIYDSYWVQVAGYDLLLEENGYDRPQNYRILSIPRNDQESFKEEQKKDLKIFRKIFINLVEQYYLNQELRGFK